MKKVVHTGMDLDDALTCDDALTRTIARCTVSPWIEQLTDWINAEVCRPDVDPLITVQAMATVFIQTIACVAAQVSPPRRRRHPQACDCREGRRGVSGTHAAHPARWPSMRFVKAQRHGPFVDTARKRAALRRKQRLEREAFPLFAEQIAAQQSSEDDVMAARALKWDRWQEEHRAQRAALWRRARQRLAGYGENTRRILRHLWDTAPYPGTPGYLLDMLHSYDVGRLDPENPPWIWRGGEMNMEAVRRTIERIHARKAAKECAA